MYRDALSRAMSQKDQKGAGRSCNQAQSWCQSYIPPLTRRRQAELGPGEAMQVREAYSFQTMHGHRLFKRVWCAWKGCPVARRCARWATERRHGCIEKLTVC